MGSKWTQEQKDAAKIAYAEKIARVKEGKEVKLVDNNLLQKVEQFNGEEVPERIDKPTGMTVWEDEDKVNSIVNTIKILPPNMIRDGRHTIENIQAINVFRVTPELIDAAYNIFQHDL
jgi:hypothetical protein